jgi:hypothetical protein
VLSLASRCFPSDTCGTRLPDQTLKSAELSDLPCSVHALPKPPQVLFLKLHEESAGLPAPAIALNATDEPIAVVVDFDQLALALGAGAAQCHHRRGRLFISAARDPSQARLTRLALFLPT